MTAVTHVRSSGLLLSLSTKFTIRGEAWKQLNEANVAQGLRWIDDADFVAQLVAEAEASAGGRCLWSAHEREAHAWW